MTVLVYDVTRVVAEHLYSLLNSFLLCKPTVDMTNVPEFYKLFNSSSHQVRPLRMLFNSSSHQVRPLRMRIAR